MAQSGEPPVEHDHVKEQSGGPPEQDQVDEPAVGKRCTVKGYAGDATIRWIGEHHVSGKSRIGVEFDEKVGKNNGSVKVSTCRTTVCSCGGGGSSSVTV